MSGCDKICKQYFVTKRNRSDLSAIFCISELIIMNWNHLSASFFLVRMNQIHYNKLANAKANKSGDVS